MNVILIIYYIQNIIILTCNKYKIINKIFYIFYTKSWKFSTYFTLRTHLSKD